jgi:hypothetical protein
MTSTSHSAVMGDNRGQTPRRTQENSPAAHHQSAEQVTRFGVWRRANARLV